MFNNKQGYVANLPSSIQPFYIDELRSEPTGEMVREEYEYYDEDGNLQIGTHLVPEYHDVNYTVEKPRWDLKEWRYVELAKTYEAKKHGIYKACEAEEWQYHDKFVEWYFRPEPVRARNEDGTLIGDNPETPENEAWENGFTPEMYDAQLEPVNNATNPEPKIRELDIEMAKVQRDTGQYAPITVDGNTYDADSVSYKKMNGSLGSWETLVNDAELIAAGAVVDSKLVWVLEDDSKVAITKVQLQSVVDAIAIRTAILQAQYSEVKG